MSEATLNRYLRRNAVMANPTVPYKKEGTGTAAGTGSGAGQFGQAKSQGQENIDKAKEAAGGVMDKARDVASNVASTAGDLASNVGKRADDATTAVGGGMKSLAQTIRENAPHGGMVVQASGMVASTLDSSGRYLQDSGLSDIADDVTNVIRRNPIPAVLVGIGIGFLIARATMSRR
jgi:hypothetical protein